MPKTVRFQDPGEGIHDAEIVSIAVSEGEEVKEGQVLLTVETDKAEFEVSSPHSGVVESVSVNVGDMIEVGEPILTIGSGADRGREKPGREERKAERERGKDERERGKAERERMQAEREREKTEHAERGADEAGAAPARGERDSDKHDEPAEEPVAREDEATAEREREPGPGDEEEATVAAAQEAPSRRAPARAERAEAEEEGERAERAAGRPRAAAPARERDDEEGPTPASPATRRIARELGVDLRDVPPTGEAGRVLAQDVRAFAQSAGERSVGAARRGRALAPPLPDFSRWGEIERVPVRSVRRTIARRMLQAWETIPHVTHQDVVDVTDLEAFRRRRSSQLVEAGEPELSLTVLVLKAAAAALAEFDRFNASFDSEAEELVFKRYCHIGVATDTPRGLLVPVLRDVDRKSLRVLSRELTDLARRAREGELGRAEMEGGSFTLTNVGAIGGTFFSPIINPPQVAILGLGRARLEARVRGDLERPEIAPRLVLPLCLAFDHRVNDGADAARFVNRIGGMLADPESLVLEI